MNDRPLKNPEAEACAQAIAKVINDRTARQALFQAFLNKHPALRNWEAMAISGRATSIARAKALETAMSAEDEREEKLRAEVFDPAVSDLEYFKRRCAHYNIPPA